MPPKKQKKQAASTSPEVQEVKENPQKQEQKKPQLVQKQLKVVNKEGEKVEVQKSKIKQELGDGVFQKDQINIASWNINGLRAVLKKEDFTKYFSSGKHDIICLNELKIDEATFLKENLGSKFQNDYFGYLNFCKPPKLGYSGVAIYSKVKPISVKHDIGISKHDQEGRTLTLEFQKFYFVACYVPNSGQKLDRLPYRTKEWDIDFRRYLNELKNKKPTILCGDLNVSHKEIDLANPKANLRSAGFTIEERTEFTAFLNEGWVDSFRHLHPKEVKYSYFSARSNAKEQNKGWRLDYFVINQDAIDAIEESDINLEVNGSDHVPIEMVLNLTKL